MSRRKPHILIYIDHKWRDLPGYVWLKIILEKKYGFSVTLAPTGLTLPLPLPDVVIFNHLLEKEKLLFAQKLKKNNIKIIMLPTEGIPSLDGGIEYLFTRDQDIQKLIDLYLVWNKPSYQHLIKYKDKFAYNVRCIGVPRFDFYRKPLNNLLIDKNTFFKKYNLSLNKPTILFATNFTQASFYEKNKDFFLKNVKSLKLSNYIDTDEFPKLDWESRNLFFESLEYLIKNINIELNIIIKPHPSEDHIPFYNFLNKIKSTPNLSCNIAMVFREYIWDVLNVSDVLIARTCTTHLEAWLLNKTTIDLQLHHKLFYFNKERAKGNILVRKKEELLKILKEILISQTPLDSKTIIYQNNIIDKWCGKVDGKRTIACADNIAEFIKDKVQTTKQTTNLFDILPYLLRYYLKVLFKEKLKIFTYKKYNTDFLGRTDKVASKKDINVWYKKLIEYSNTIGENHDKQ